MRELWALKIWGPFYFLGTPCTAAHYFQFPYFSVMSHLMLQACAPRYVYFSINKRRMEPVGTCFTAMDSFSRFSEYSPCRTGKYIMAGKLKFMKMQIIWVTVKDAILTCWPRVFTQEELMWKIKLCWSVPGSSSCWNHPAVTTARRSRTKIQIAHWLSNFSGLGIPQTRILPGGLRCCSHQGMYQAPRIARTDLMSGSFFHCAILSLMLLLICLLYK